MSYCNRGTSHARGYLGIVNVRCDRCHHQDDVAQTYGVELDGSHMDTAEIGEALRIVRRDAASVGWTVPPRDQWTDVHGRDYCPRCSA